MWWISKDSTWTHRYRTRVDRLSRERNSKINISVGLDDRMIYCEIKNPMEGCGKIFDGKEYYDTKTIPTIGKRRALCPKCESKKQDLVFK
tara:strand:- start:224 stop:493 length:270 start_codon:yes stop_codon:yes gene_type:complete